MASQPGDPRRTHRWKTIAAKMCATATHCTRCGVTLDRHDPRRKPTVDHYIPLIHGGDPFDPANLRVVCNSCNASMGATVGNRRRKARRQPRRLPAW